MFDGLLYLHQCKKGFFRFSEIFDNLEPENMNFWDKLDPKHH